MVWVRSEAIWMSIAGETEEASWGSSALMRSTVSMMFAPGWRRTMISTERTPLVQPATRRLLTLSSTFATSPSRTTPFGVWARRRLRYSSARKS